MTRVLIVDDEPAYLESLTWAISDEKLNVQTAGSPGAAIEVGRRFRPDVLIVDWALQNQLNGLDVSDGLRGLFPNLVTILITGYGTSELRLQAEKAQVFAFLEKPFEPDDLRRTIRRAIDSASRTG